MNTEQVAPVRDLATALVELGEQDALRSFQLPYPPAAQRALDRMVLRCIDLGLTPPKGLPELIEWCRRLPVGDRVFEAPPAPLLLEATLVHPTGRLPTRTCLELASTGPDGGPEETARRLLTDLAGRCGSDERFHRSREFLARNPLVCRENRFRRVPGMKIWNKEVWSRVKDLYRPLPESLIVEGTLLRCGTCGLPALLGDRQPPNRRTAVSGLETWCEDETCPHGVPMDLIRVTEGVRLLAKPLRSYLSLPIRLEEAALGALDRAAVGHRSVPGELSVHELQGVGLTARRLYVHDRIHPALSAERFGAVSEPVAVVVPDQAARDVRYRAAFEHALPDPERVVLAGPADLVARLRYGKSLR